MCLSVISVMRGLASIDISDCMSLNSHSAAALGKQESPVCLGINSVSELKDLVVISVGAYVFPVIWQKPRYPSMCEIRLDNLPGRQPLGAALVHDEHGRAGGMVRFRAFQAARGAVRVATLRFAQAG